MNKYGRNESAHMEQALSYFDHFKDGLFLYRKDGSYPIDNNLAERQVRPFTAMRKVIQLCGSDEGADSSLPKCGEHGEACWRVGVAFLRRLL